MTLMGLWKGAVLTFGASGWGDVGIDFGSGSVGQSTGLELGEWGRHVERSG